MLMLFYLCTRLFGIGCDSRVLKQIDEHDYGGRQRALRGSIAIVLINVCLKISKLKLEGEHTFDALVTPFSECSMCGNPEVLL